MNAKLLREIFQSNGYEVIGIRLYNRGEVAEITVKCPTCLIFEQYLVSKNELVKAFKEHQPLNAIFRIFGSSELFTSTIQIFNFS